MEDLPVLGIELRSPALQADSLPSEPPGTPPESKIINKNERVEGLCEPEKSSGLWDLKLSLCNSSCGSGSNYPSPKQLICTEDLLKFLCLLPVRRNPGSWRWGRERGVPWVQPHLHPSPS